MAGWLVSSTILLKSIDSRAEASEGGSGAGAALRSHVSASSDNDQLTHDTFIYRTKAQLGPFGNCSAAAIRRRRSYGSVISPPPCGLASEVGMKTTDEKSADYDGDLGERAGGGGGGAGVKCDGR